MNETKTFFWEETQEDFSEYYLRDEGDGTRSGLD